jgi:hypothetical protein
MARDEYAIGIAAVVGHVLMEPGDYGATLTGDLAHADLGTQRVVGHHYGHVVRHGSARDEAELLAAQQTPPAAVDEDEDRGAWTPGGKDVDGLVNRRPEANVEVAFEVIPCLSTAFDEPLNVRRHVECRLNVVFTVDFFLCREVAIEPQGHASPSRPRPDGNDSVPKPPGVNGRPESAGSIGVPHDRGSTDAW